MNRLPNLAKLLEQIWTRTHPDFKGYLGNKRSILVYRRGTTIVPLDELTDEEILNNLPKEVSLPLRRALAGHPVHGDPIIDRERK